MTNDTDDEPLATMSDEELGQYVRETAVFRLAIACAEFVDHAEEIQANDTAAWDRLVKETMDGQSRIRSRESVEGVIRSYHEVIDDYASLARDPDELATAAAKEAAEEGK